MTKTSPALTLAYSVIIIASLSACATSGNPAHDLAQSWLDGDSSVQCLGQPSHWERYELGQATLTEAAGNVELWTVELTGTRKGKPIKDGYVLVELHKDGESCVKWSQP